MAESKKQAAADALEAVLMTNQLQELLDREDFTKALKYCSQRLVRNNKQPFFNTIKAYCLMKMGKHGECQDLMNDIKPMNQKDPYTIKYLIFIFTAFGQNEDATKLLEGVQTIHAERADLGEQLFFSYVREGKLLKQQNQGLHLYKVHTRDIYAQWAVESMYLISLSLRFETKILDIAYLLLLKLMKEPAFKIDSQFIRLYLKVLTKQGKYKEALDFIDIQSQEFEGNKIERQKQEASLFHASGNPTLTINVLFNMLRLNSNVHQYKEIWSVYRQCIRIILDDHLPKNNFEFKPTADFTGSEGGAVTNSNANFEQISVEDGHEKILRILYASLRNLRKQTQNVDLTQKRLNMIAQQMKRTSFLSELEFNYVFALRCKGMQCGIGSNFFILMLEYIDLFYDKTDVLEDLEPYLKLLNNTDDVFNIRDRFRDRIAQVESMEGEAPTLVKADGAPAIGSHLNQTVEQDFDKRVVSLKVLRWKFVQHKVSRALGLYTAMEDHEKIDLVNRIFSCFMQAMEFHPQASSSVGIGVNHSQHQYNITIEENLTDLDKKNAEDMVIIAIECLYEVKIYDFSVFNPINFQIISMCEFALPYFPESIPIYSWLVKMYSKLGLATLVTELSERFPMAQSAFEQNFERLGAYRFSVYTDFGMEQSLEDLVQEYKDFYRDKINENKNNIVTSFLHRDFDSIRPIMLKNEKLTNSGFQHAISLAHTVMQIHQHENNTIKMHAVFNKQFDHIDTICDSDSAFETRIGPSTLVDQTVFKLIRRKNMKPLTLGQSREKIKAEAIIESAYEQGGEGRLEQQKNENEKKAGKGLIRMFGYKHHRAMKFYGQLLRCLRDCYEQRFEQLNIDMNFFLLLKNELSLHFLRQTENIVATLKASIRVYASENERDRAQDEQNELKILEKILNNQPLQNEDSDQEEEKVGGTNDSFVPQSEDAAQQSMFEKIVQKLLEYNEKINSGKEISVVEYLKRIDQKSPFMQTFNNQRHLRRAFYEEFKIHCFNYILLLFESVIRMLTTMNKDDNEGEDANLDLKKGKKKGGANQEDQQHYYSKNYRRFLESRAKKIDQFVVNCIGWSHVLRCIEVIEMAMRDLIYKIVPTKIVVRELKTSTGKVLTKDSEYTLVERKKYVQVGKKPHIDYVFELDLKEEEKAETEENKQQAAQEQQSRRNLFYLNLDDFSLFKLRSAVFLIDFPLSFTMCIINVWQKIMPSQLNMNEFFQREEIEQIMQTRQSIKEFSNNMVSHVQNLLDYLIQTKRDKPMKANYTQIVHNPVFQQFKTTMLRSKGTTLVPVKVDEMFISTYEKMNESFDCTMQNIIDTLEAKIAEIKTMNMAKATTAHSGLH